MIYGFWHGIGHLFTDFSSTSQPSKFLPSKNGLDVASNGDIKLLHVFEVFFVLSLPFLQSTNVFSIRVSSNLQACLCCCRHLSLVCSSAISLTVNSLTPIWVRTGIKNYYSVEFLRRKSTFFRVFWNTTQPPATTTMVSRLPLLRNELYGYAQSNTQATRPRMSARALLLGFV